MKKHLFIFVSLGVMLFSLNSCLDDATSNYTPMIYFTDFYVNPVFDNDTLISAQDTLWCRYDTVLNVNVLDTIHLTDSIVFALACNSYSNNLTAIRINHDTTALRFDANIGNLLEIMTDQSNITAMQLYFNPGYNIITFGLGYKAKKTGTYTLEVICESDSELSPTKYVLLQPVVE